MNGVNYSDQKSAYTQVEAQCYSIIVISPGVIYAKLKAHFIAVFYLIDRISTNY